MNQFVLLMVLFILFIDFKGLIAKKVDRGVFLTMPIIGIIFTVLEFNGVSSLGSLIEAGFMFVVATIAGMIFGCLKKVTLRKDGYYIRSTWLYVIGWLLVFVGRYAALFILNIHETPSNTGWITWLYLTTYFVCRNLTLLVRHPSLKDAVFQSKD